MSEFTQRSFGSGEIGPALYPRSDTAAYSAGLRKLRNAYVRRHGGTDSRAGTVHLGEVHDSTLAVRLLPFVFSDSQTYVLEFGNEYMRVIKNGEYVRRASQAITAVTNANPCVLTYSGSDTYSNGDVVYITGIVGPIGLYLNNREFKVANVNVGSNTFELDYMDGANVNSTSFGAYTSGGTVAEVYRIVASYAVADLPTLKFAQSADVITITHPAYEVQELSRTADTSWTFAVVTFAPTVQTPTVTTTATTGPTRTGGVDYYVTSVDAENAEESEPLLVTSNVATPAPGTPATLALSQPLSGPRAGAYNIYRDDNSGAYFIGSVAESGAITNKFIDTGIALDLETAVPISPTVYSSTDNYPSCVGIVRQRRAFANTNTNSEEVRLTRIGAYKNFITSNPLQDDDPIKFTMAGVRVNAVKHILDVGGLPVVFTESSEVTLEGDGGVLTPFGVNPKTYSRNGCSDLAPIIVDNTALYVQARGSIVRDLLFDYQSDGYKGNDLTIFASHLVDGFTIVDWAYAQTPHSIIWAVRSDGVLLSLSYVRDQNIRAWAKHDMDGGLVENVCIVPEGTEDAVYLVVKRTINGRSVRYVERMNTRQILEREDMILMDSALTYDGRNTGSTTMTLSGGTTWAYDETITLTASASYFSSDDVGDVIQVTGADGTLIQFEITAYTSATVVSGRPDKTVPVAMRSAARTTWAHAVDTVSGLWHLEGEAVSILGDGVVVGSPNNPSVATYTVTNGSITLDDQYSVIHVGLPFVADLQTLDIDTPEGESLNRKPKLITEVTLHLEKSAGIFVGTEEPTGTDLTEGLYELKVREFEGYDEATDLVTGKSEIIVESTWNKNGRVFIRQVDPLPMSVLAISPSGFMGNQG
jgi:hypothetical protein